MSFIKEFKEFAVKGNVMDLAVGVIIGGAFSKIIDSVVKDVVMPLIGTIVGNVDFSNLYVVLKSDTVIPDGTDLAKARELGVIFAYGNFITVAINFILLAFVVFLLVKGMNKLRQSKEVAPAAPAAPPEPSATEKLLMEIRDELKQK